MHMSLETCLENTLLYEKMIKVESLILNNKITFFLHVPITKNDSFSTNYLHLYSVPIYMRSV